MGGSNLGSCSKLEEESCGDAACLKQGEQGEKGGKVHREQPGKCRHKCGAHRSWTHSSGPGATEKVANWSSSQEDFFVSWGTELRFFFSNSG